MLKSLALTISLIPGVMFAQFTQQGSKLVGTGVVGRYADQGTSVAISADGDTALVGGPSDNNLLGAVWVFTHSADVWTQGSKLVPADAFSSAKFGRSVALSADGNTAAIGGPSGGTNGAVWIFTRSAGVWAQQGPKFSNPAGADGRGQGLSVAISGDGSTVIEGDEDSKVWVFTQSSGVWTAQGQLVGPPPLSPPYQYSVVCALGLSADGNTAVIGDYYDNSFQGAIWIFTRSGGVWTQQAKLVSSDVVNAEQGYSVAISGDGNTVVEGAPFASGTLGGVFVFTRSGGVWSQQGPLLVGSGAVGAVVEQGSSVAISPDGDWIVEGGWSDNNSAGAVWAFTRTAGVWSQVGSKLVGTGAAGSYVSQGICVALSAEGTLIAGGPYDTAGPGAAWVFHNPAVGPILPQLQMNLVSGSGFGGQDLQISWPASGANFILQFSSGLGAPIQWVPVTGGPVLSDGQYHMRDPLTSGSRFYRLKSP